MKLINNKISLIGLFTALGVTLGFIFCHIPNVELLTATIFISGFIMGIKEGLMVGIFSESIYSIFNPMGVAFPPLFIAQVLAMSLTGALGGLFKKWKFQSTVTFHLTLGLSGFFTTFIFAVLTTLSFTLFIKFSWKNLLGSFVFGLGFYITHLLTNTIIFLTIVPLILNICKKVTS